MNSAAREWADRGDGFTAGGVAGRVWSEGAGDPVVCLHGVPASSFIYRRLLGELAARGRRAVAFDLPGLGLAERPEDFDYSWSGLSAWTAAAVEALDLENVHLVVHDVGGPIGLDAVRRDPARFSGLTLLNTMVRVSDFRRPWMMEAYARRGVGEAALACTSPGVLAAFIRRVGVLGPVPDEELRAYGHLLKRGDGGRSFLRIMRGFERTRDFEDRIVGVLEARRVPAQVVWGEDDPVLRIDHHGEEAREAVGAPFVHRVRGRHFVMEDSPSEVADRVVGLEG